MSHKKERTIVHKSPLELLLEGSWDHIYNPEEDNFLTISSILKEIEFFKRTFPTQAEFDIFLDIAKNHFVHEVHEYGTVLTRERDYATKFCIVLKGSVQKLVQRSQNDIESDMKNSEFRLLHKVTQENLENALTNSPKLGPRPSIDFRQSPASQRKNLTWLGVESAVPQSRFSRSGTGEFNNSPALSRSSSRNFTELESPKLVNNRSSSPSVSQLSPIMSPLPDVDRKRSPSLSIGPIFLRSLESDKKRRSTTKVTVKVRNAIKLQTEIITPIGKTGGSGRSSIRSQLFSRSNTGKWGDEIDQKNGENQLNIGLTEREEEEEEEEKLDNFIEDMSPISKRTNNAFVRFIASKYPEIKHRCVNHEVILLTNNKTFNQGDWFGESSLKEEQIRESGIIAVSTEEVHLLTITREAYRQVMNLLSLQASARIVFFRKIFDKFDDEQLGFFSKNFNKRAFLKGETIYHQGDNTDALYILLSGEVKLFKESFQPTTNILTGTLSTFKNTKKKVDLPIASIVEKQSFGEEVLLHHKNRQYTAVVTNTNTEVYSLNLSDYKSIKSGFHLFFRIMKEEAKKRFEWREERTNILVEKQKKEFIRASNTRMTILAVDTSKSMLDSGNGLEGESPTRIVAPGSATVETAVKTVEFDDSESISPLFPAAMSKEKDERNFISPRNLEAYRKRFSRRLDFSNTIYSNGFSPEKKRNDSINLGDSIDDFNVRKELKMMNKPKLSMSRLSSPQISPVSSPKVYMPSLMATSKEDSASPTLEIKKVKEKRINFASVKELHSGKLESILNIASPKVKAGGHKKNNKSVYQNLNFVETVSNVESSKKKEEMSKLLQFVNYKTSKYKLSPLMEQKARGVAWPASTSHKKSNSSAACFSFIVNGGSSKGN